jgi:serine phosphatase RsbU (regulator of sigma subunit)
MTGREADWMDLLEATVSTSSQGMIVADAGGTVVLANRAANDLLGGGDLWRLLGATMEETQREIVKWRFTNPGDYERRVLDSLTTGRADSWEQETLEGRLLEIRVEPLSGEGGVIGHVQTLVDLTRGRRELEEARREGRARAEDLEVLERQISEEIALTHAAYQIATALAPEEIHRRLMAEAARLANVERLAILKAKADGPTELIVARGFSGAAAEALAEHAQEAVAQAVDSRRTVLCNDSTAESSPTARAAAGAGLRALMLVPVTLAERAYGVLAVCADGPRAFGEREVRVLTELSGHAASALANAQQFARNRELADSFQHSVVAKGLPEIPGLQLAALYRAAAGELIGGDFYDVLELPDGRVAVLVGDVSGKGPRAAATTAMVRHMIEGLLAQERDPALLIGELNSLLCARLADDALVTMVMALYDPRTSSLVWCNAGHPPPLLIGRAGRVTELGRPGPPCGCLEDAEYAAHTDAFTAGDTLLLYTDGLTEARLDGEEFGHARLVAEALRLNGGAPAAISRGLYATVRAWSGGNGVVDDVAIAVVRHGGD